MRYRRMPMYKSDPNAPKVEINHEEDMDKRVSALEKKLSHLIEEITKIRATIAIVGKTTRRHNSDLNNMSTVIQSKLDK